MQWVSNVRQTIDAMKVFYKGFITQKKAIIYISYTSEPYPLRLAKSLSKDGRTKK
jgi:hypothetical protein